MKKTLYVLRRRQDKIPLTLFYASDPDIEVVFIEQAASETVSYDELVRKIFEADRTVVI